MGTTKTKSFDEKSVAIADVFKAFGNPARLQILTILLEKKQCTCGAIVDLVPLSQSTISKHLIELKKAGLIGEFFEGKKTIFFLKKEGLKITTKYLNEFYNICKFKEVFTVEKNTYVKTNTKKNTQTVPIKFSSKYKNRKPNPDLKKHNYVFNFLKTKS